MQFKTVDFVTRLGKIAKVNKTRNWDNELTTEYKVMIVNAPNRPVYSVASVNGEWRIYIGGSRIGYASKLRSAIKIAASHAIDKVDTIKSERDIYSYSRGNGANIGDSFTAKTVKENGMKIKHHRHTVFH